MKMISLTFAVLAFLNASSARETLPIKIQGNDQGEKARKEQISEYVTFRRNTGRLSSYLDPKETDLDITEKGVIHQPKEIEEGSLVSFHGHKIHVAVAAAMYASIKRKEVMVSSTVAGKTFTLQFKQKEQSEALEIFENQFTELGISIREIPGDIIVLSIDKNKANKSAHTTSAIAPR